MNIRTFTDFLWPTLAPQRPPAVKRADERAAAQQEQIAFLRDHLSDDDRLAKIEESCAALLIGEDSRRTSIDARLGTTLGLASVAAAITWGALSARATAASSPDWVTTACSALTFYVVVQAVAAILASIRGLERRGYLELASEDVLPKLTESAGDHTKRRIQTCLECVSDHRSQNAAKLNQMALAQCAMRNLSIGILLIIGVVTVSSFLARPRTSSAAGCGCLQKPSRPSATSAAARGAVAPGPSRLVKTPPNPPAARHP